MGRRLRGLFNEAGFPRVEAFADYISYGTPDRAIAFAHDRAMECRDEESLDRDAGQFGQEPGGGADAPRRGWTSAATPAQCAEDRVGVAGSWSLRGRAGCCAASQTRLFPSGLVLGLA